MSNTNHHRVSTLVPDNIVVLILDIEAHDHLRLIANERLSQETLRANESERQSAEILAHFKIIHQENQRLEIDFQRVKDELGLYKTQLDIAQAGMFLLLTMIMKVLWFN